MTGYKSKRAAAQDKLAQPAQEPWPEEPLGHMAWGVQSAQEHCQCPACKDGKLHWSDCAVHDEPALAAELCNCGVVNPRIVTQRDTPSEAFFEWWDSDYDDSRNPFRKDGFAYWAWAGWQAALAQPAQELWAGVDFDIKLTPPQRPWVDLTEDEIEVIEEKALTKQWAIRMALAAVKERNA